MGKMIPKTKVHFDIKYPNITAECDIDLGRFDQQYVKGQYLLDSMVMTDMIPYMPMQTGTFINITKAMSEAIAGTGKVVAAAPPMGRFLYEGKVMVDEATGSPFARPGAKKILVSQYSGKTAAKENLEYSKNQHPKVTSKWFEEAKKNHGDVWVRKIKKISGGG